MLIAKKNLQRTNMTFGRNFTSAVMSLGFGIMLCGAIDVRVLLDDLGSSAPGVGCIDNISDIAFRERKLGTIILSTYPSS